MRERRKGIPQPIEPARALTYIQSLSSHQKKALQLCADGKTKAQAARELGVAEGTADTHIRRVAENFSLDLSRRKALMYLIRVGVKGGAIAHDLPEGLESPTVEESRMIKLIRRGKAIEDLDASFQVVKAMQKVIYTKLRVKNDYELEARMSAIESQNNRNANQEVDTDLLE